MQILKTFDALATILAGGILLVAGLLKVSSPNALFISPFLPIPALWLHLVILQLEFSLSFWLILKSGDDAPRLTALLAFAVMAVVNAINGALGASSCGCLGEIRVSPWAMFSLDVLMVALLSLAIRNRIVPRKRMIWSGVLKFMVGQGLAACLIGALVTIAFGSPERMMAVLRRDVVFARPASLNFGVAESGAIVERTFTVENRSPHVIRIIGATSDCSCASTSALPIDIPPGETRPMTIILRFPPDRGIVQRTSQLWTDHPDDSAVTIVLSGYSTGIHR